MNTAFIGTIRTTDVYITRLWSKNVYRVNAPRPIRQFHPGSMSSVRKDTLRFRSSYVMHYYAESATHGH